MKQNCCKAGNWEWLTGRHSEEIKFRQYSESL